MAWLIIRIAQREDAAELLAPHTPQEEKVLLRKVDLILMTLLQFALSELKLAPQELDADRQ